MESRGAVTMPPTMGAAIRCITSLPVPLPHRMDNRPARMTATVIALGRTRNKAPSRMASSKEGSGICAFWALRFVHDVRFLDVTRWARRSSSACNALNREGLAEVRRW